jgi:hypothetical protein
MWIGFSGTGTADRHLRPEVAGPEHEVPTEPDMMDEDAAELAHRRGAAIEVTLLWHRTTQPHHGGSVGGGLPARG